MIDIHYSTHPLTTIVKSFMVNDDRRKVVDLILVQISFEVVLTKR